MKKLLVLATTLLCGLSLTACGGVSYEGIEDYERVEGRETIKIGLECNYAPFNWSQPTATGTCLPIYGTSMYVDGYDVQIAKHIANELEVNVELYMVEWDNLMLELNNNNIDLIIAGMSPTEERQKSIAFTDAYYTSDFVVVTTATSQYASATSISDLAGATGCGQAETLYDDIIQDLGDDVYGAYNITANTPASTVPLIALGLANGDFDFTILEKPVAQSLLASNSDLVIVELYGSNPFNVSDEDRTVAIGARLTDTDLVSRVNTALSTLSSYERNSLMTAAVNRSA